MTMAMIAVFVPVIAAVAMIAVFVPVSVVVAVFAVRVCVLLGVRLIMVRSRGSLREGMNIFAQMLVRLSSFGRMRMRVGVARQPVMITLVRVGTYAGIFLRMRMPRCSHETASLPFTARWGNSS